MTNSGVAKLFGDQQIHHEVLLSVGVLFNAMTMSHKEVAKMFNTHLVQQPVMTKLFKVQHRVARLFRVVLRTHKEVAVLSKEPQVL